MGPMTVENVRTCNRNKIPVYNLDGLITGRAITEIYAVFFMQ